jgi:MFS transporter, ACS family, allantoate permease
MAILLVIRYVLSTENKRRDREQLVDTYNDIYIERMGKDGQVEKVKVDKVINILLHDVMRYWFIVYQEFLDLTDIQNRDFRYVL